jgi:hypothetical protein
MKNRIFLIGSGLIFLWMNYFGCAVPPEKTNSLSIDASLDTTQAAIGDIVHLHIEVNGVSNQQLEFSELEVKTPIEIREKSIFQEENKIQFQIVFWDTGTFEIPEYSVGIRHLQDSTLNYSLKTESLEITILSTLTEGSQSELKPIKGPVPILYPTPWAKIVQWSFLAVAIIILLIVWSKRNISHSFFPAQYNNIRTPFNQAVERLENLDNSMDDNTFYVNLSHILREFVENSVFIKSLEMTTEEIQSNKNIIPLEDTLFEQWISLLSRADQIKFARRISSQSQRNKDIKWSKDFLKWTRSNWKLI